MPCRISTHDGQGALLARQRPRGRAAQLDRLSAPCLVATIISRANVRTVFTGLADRVTRYDWGQEVAPGIMALDTSGHTPGHSSFAVQSGSGKMLVQSDV